MKVFYFGPWGGPGHYVWTPDGDHPRPERAGPWGPNELDASSYKRDYGRSAAFDTGRGFCPVDPEEPQGVWRLTRAVYLFEPWTAIGCWDRTSDRRGNSKAVFVAEGEHDMEAMQRIAAEHFPAVWARILGGQAMIAYRSGNLLDSGADALVNPVNARGVSGKGLALAFKAWAPDAVRLYSRYASAGRMRPGEVVSFYTMRRLTPAGRGALIYFAATKDDWRDPSRIEWVAAAVDTIAGCAVQAVSSIAIPALGCGLGGLRWEDVRPLIHAAAQRMAAAGVRVWIYEPVEPGRRGERDRGRGE